MKVLAVVQPTLQDQINANLRKIEVRRLECCSELTRLLKNDDAASMRAKKAQSRAPNGEVIFRYNYSNYENTTI